jgi:hypothetical protein
MPRNELSSWVGGWFLLTVPMIFASNSTDAPSLVPISRQVSADAVNCTMETSGNVSSVKCINYCGSDTWFDFQMPTSDMASLGEMWEYPVNEISCQMACGGNISVIEESVCHNNLTSSNLTTAAFSSRDVCQQYCDMDVPLWSDCVETTNTTTTCHVNLPSPLVYTLADATLLTIGNESALYIECPTGQDASSENCTCTLTIGSAQEACQDCFIASVSYDNIRYGFNCSNHFTDVCAIVNGDGECTNNATEITVVPRNVSLVTADESNGGCSIQRFTDSAGVARDFFVCPNFCGPGTSLRTVYQLATGLNRDATLSFWDYSEDFFCFLTCKGQQLDCSYDYFNVKYLVDLCQKCDYQKPLFNISGTSSLGITFYRLELPSPLPFKIQDQKFLYLGTESSLFLECPTGKPKNSTNCKCKIFKSGNPQSGASEQCSGCELITVSDEAIEYKFDCSNLFPYDLCSAVNEVKSCVNPRSGFQCSLASTAAGLGYTCGNYCGPDSQFVFTFKDIMEGTVGTNNVFVYNPTSVVSQCQLRCKGNAFKSIDCAGNFSLSTSPLPYREICNEGCQIDVSPYVELRRNSTFIRYQLNSLSPLQKPLSNGDILFLGEDSYFYMDCQRGKPFSAATCVCRIFAAYTELFSERAEFCNRCDIGYFQNDRPVYGFDCRNLFTGSCAVVNPGGDCIVTPSPTRPPINAGPPGKGKGKGKGGKGKGGMMQSMKTPKEPKTAKAMMASEKGKKGAYGASAESAANQKESDTPKGPMSSKQVVS